LNDAIHIVKDLVGRNTIGANAGPGEIAIASLVTRRIVALPVYRAVHFNGEPRTFAVEIEDEWPGWRLTAKLETLRPGFQLPP
jgi:hypothetical protein